MSNDSAALHSSGVTAYQAGQYDRAVELISGAITQNPQIPQFHNTIGVVYKALGRNEDAISAYRQALQLEPDFADAYYNLANALHQQGQCDEAIENYNRAVRLKPDMPEACYNLANALQKQGRNTEAIENYRCAIRFRPDYVKAYNNLAGALKKQGRLAEALTNCEQVIRLKPDCPEAYYNLANVLWDQRQYLRSIEYNKLAIQLKPDYPEAHLNLSLAFLLLGRFEQGWQEYQWRQKTELNQAYYQQSCEKPRWDGSAFAGKRLFVHCEQGLGDCIQFIRYLPMVKARGGTVIFQTWKSLVGLFEDFPEIDELVGAAPGARSDAEFDFYISLLDLPGIFETTLETIPAEMPYLYAEPEKTRYWRNRLDEPGFKVGIVWAGSSQHRNDHNRSCALKHFAPLAVIDGVRLYSLQKGPAAIQLNNLPEDMTITSLGEHLKDFTDTAAAIENLDLVISVDTAALHLAGAMGKPAWGLIPFAPDWRWMLERSDSPWYPTIRLFRQEKWGDWNGVFQHVEKSVRDESKLLAGKPKHT
ncbi:MAG: tetratricopeptide repeat protein [Planctomycetota bacterium]|jgi:tetratricopeptide (TPR) repeat protein